MDLPPMTCKNYLKLDIFEMSKLNLTLIWPTKYLLAKSKCHSIIFRLLDFGLGLDIVDNQHPPHL